MKREIRADTIIAVIALVIALAVLFFGENIYQQITGRSFFQTVLSTPTTLPSSNFNNSPPPLNDGVPSSNLAAEITDFQGVQMVLVSAGEFTMGSDSDHDDVKPAHKVNLDNFYIDKYEVTNVFYKTCVSSGACDIPIDKKSGTRSSYYDNPEFDNYPVVYVNWHMAKTYCEWRGSRLPTEAEWEKASRGSSSNVYPWGNIFDGTKINFCDLNCGEAWANKNYDDGYRDTAPVDSYPGSVSIYGIYNMLGNVWEWTSSLYQPYPYNKIDGREDANASGDRVVRGGSWYDGSNNIYPFRRLSSDTKDYFVNLGIRCARNVNP